jgi:ribosomal protein S6
VEAYNKIVKNEFLAVEDISKINDRKLRYEMKKHTTRPWSMVE